MPLDSKEVQPPVKQQIKPMTTFVPQPPVPVTNPTSTSMFSDKPMSICSPYKKTAVDPPKKPRQSFSQILMEIVNEENAKKKLSSPVKTPVKP